MTDRLEPGQGLTHDQSIVSARGYSTLTMQADGNLVLYCARPSGWIARWASATNGTEADRCVMQDDGNFVLYASDTAVWASDTARCPGAHLILQDDENVVLYQGSAPVWASQTSLDGTPIKGEDAKVYYLFQGVRHHIPDPETLVSRYGGWSAVSILGDAQVAIWPEGDAAPTARAPLPEIRMCIDKTVSGGILPPRQVPIGPPRITGDGSILGVVSQPLTGQTEKMWDVASTLKIKMLGGTPFVRGKVRQYAEEWTRYANIHLEFVDPSQPAQIRVAFDPGGSWSAVGRDALWTPFDFATMNFGWFDDSTSDDEFSRVVLHEFGHALGLVHEHQSPVSGIQWDREKAYAYYKETMGWDRAKVDDQVFQKYSVSSTNYSQFDPSSIMEYQVPASITLDGSSIPSNSALSNTDKEYIRRWYPSAPNPGAAIGLLRTGDDCDEIDFRVEYNSIPADQIGFSLVAATGITWWKAIEVPTGSSEYSMFSVGNGGRIELAQIDKGRPIRFWKAKFLGVHTRLDYVWDVLTALPGGCILYLTWKRDRC